MYLTCSAPLRSSLRLACCLLTAGVLLARPAQAQDDTPEALPPADGGLIQPALFQYRIDMNMMGQEMTMEGLRTIEAATYQDRPVWRLVDGGDSPWGPYADTVEVDRATLLPVRQRTTGSGNVTLLYTEAGVTGEMNMGQGAIPINTPLDAPVYGAESALELALAGMPLAEGYATTLRSFHSYSQQARAMRLEVTGTTTVTVPAGTFETLVVEMAPIEGDGSENAVLHVLPAAPHYVVEATYTLPKAAGGGSIVVTMLDQEAGSEKE